MRYVALGGVAFAALMIASISPCLAADQWGLESGRGIAQIGRADGVWTAGNFVCRRSFGGDGLCHCHERPCRRHVES